jgi:hypothetical protein
MEAYKGVALGVESAWAVFVYGGLGAKRSTFFAAARHADPGLAGAKASAC